MMPDGHVPMNGLKKPANSLQWLKMFFRMLGCFTIQWDIKWDILDGRWFFQVLTTKRSLSIGNITIDWW